MQFYHQSIRKGSGAGGKALMGGVVSLWCGEVKCALPLIVIKFVHSGLQALSDEQEVKCQMTR
jgi:mevalonate pyrophosphate decarboxylase